MPVYGLAVFIIVVALLFDYINRIPRCRQLHRDRCSDAGTHSISSRAVGRVLQFRRGVHFWNSGRQDGGDGLCGSYAGHATGDLVWNRRRDYLGSDHVVASRPSHQFVARSLIGGYAGAAIARAGILRGFTHSFEALQVPGGSQWPLHSRLHLPRAPDRIDLGLCADGRGLLDFPKSHAVNRDGHLLSKRCSCSLPPPSVLSHGSNDAQKTDRVDYGSCCSPQKR